MVLLDALAWLKILLPPAGFVGGGKRLNEGAEAAAGAVPNRPVDAEAVVAVGVAKRPPAVPVVPVVVLVVFAPVVGGGLRLKVGIVGVAVDTAG